MEYRHLGRTGIRVSELSLGSWITFKNQVDVDAAKEIMAARHPKTKGNETPKSFANRSE